MYHSSVFCFFKMLTSSYCSGAVAVASSYFWSNSSPGSSTSYSYSSSEYIGPPSSILFCLLSFSNGTSSSFIKYQFVRILIFSKMERSSSSQLIFILTYDLQGTDLPLKCAHLSTLSLGLWLFWKELLHLYFLYLFQLKLVLKNSIFYLL